MGVELADSAARKGASVFLICGPTNFEPNESGVQTIKVTTAEEMYNSVHQYFDKIDVAILSAVADYKPVNTSLSKIKKVIMGH